MYQGTKSNQLQGLGLSLKPPSWLKNAVRGAVTDTVDAATKAARDAAAKAAQEAANRLQPPAPKDPVQQAKDLVNNIPGGWVTIALGLGAVLMLSRSRK